ncbi:hypothetical protein PRIPAC_79156 [Pristionchus pacificus]|uniref:Uncharacterized protein n=1 Tax=Pristionchus pacificus TaxID=54126 RepID=A0A454XW79_PRIPA|nr:hypothetical protein PRIPAC_79156 [Pristionchus pacificus]|eukprot:PDM73132.1 hypothetical protein PRIPAC_39566 [Pristionchus pacificus]
MPKQEFDLLDYTAPIIVGILFAIGLFFSSLIINFTCIKKDDEITHFEKWGARRNIRLGPHSLSVVKKHLDKRYITDEDV